MRNGRECMETTIPKKEDENVCIHLPYLTTYFTLNDANRVHQKKALSLWILRILQILRKPFYDEVNGLLRCKFSYGISRTVNVLFRIFIWFQLNLQFTFNYDFRSRKRGFIQDLQLWWEWRCNGSKENLGWFTVVHKWGNLLSL